MSDKQHYEETGALKEKIKQLGKLLKEKDKEITEFQKIINNMVAGVDVAPVELDKKGKEVKVGLRAKRHKKNSKGESFILHKRGRSVAIQE